MGDQWLKDRLPPEKGKGGRVLLRALSPYLKKAGAQEFFIRRNLQNRYQTEQNASLDWIRDYEKSRLHQSQAIVPVQITGGSWLGFGYGHQLQAKPGRFLLGQVESTGWFYWEGYGKGQIQPRQDFRHLGKSGPIYQIFIPLYNLEPIETEPGLFRLAKKNLLKDQLIRVFKNAILASHQILLYENTVLRSIHFGDVLYQDGVSVLDGSGNPPGSKTPGIRLSVSQ